MDWQPLLNSTPDYRSALRAGADVEARVTTARARFRAYLDAVTRIEVASGGEPEAPATFGAVVAAAFGPGEVAPAWRRWRARAEAPVGALERLERDVEASQREVSRVALWIDALSAEEAHIRAEMEDLRGLVRDAAADATTAADTATRLARGLDAVAIAQARAGPVEGAALDADAAVLEGLVQARRAEAGAFERAATRLGGVLAFGTEALAACARLRAALDQVHAEGTEVLHALDVHLARLAAEARAADLGASLASGMETLRGSVGRVHLQAREDVGRLVHRLDALAEAPDLLAPTDPARIAAEAEVAALVGGTRRG